HLYRPPAAVSLIKVLEELGLVAQFGILGDEQPRPRGATISIVLGGDHAQTSSNQVGRRAPVRLRSAQCLHVLRIEPDRRRRLSRHTHDIQRALVRVKLYQRGSGAVLLGRRLPRPDDHSLSWGLVRWGSARECPWAFDRTGCE